MSLIDNIAGSVVDGKYSVEVLLGQGGMGAVYKATHLGTGRPVALKIIAPEFMRRDDSIERFRREEQAMGLLRHPNVVDVTDFGFWDGELGPIAYLVMEYLDGLSLRQFLDREGSLPLQAVIEILEQVCVAMERAHQHGVLHRDLKPDNIWLEPNDLGGYTVKVLDFGLARIASSEPTGEKPLEGASHGATLRTSEPALVDDDLAQDEATILKTGDPDADDATTIRDDPGSDATMLRDPRESEADGADTWRSDETTVREAETDLGVTRPAGESSTPMLTRAGSLLGTPVYMSPEQCRGESIDSRSDIYSLGIIAYEMLTGVRPFVGSTQDLIWKHNHEPVPPISERRTDVPAAVISVIESCLEKEPTKRPRSPAALASMLRARAESFGRTLRRALILYTENFGPMLRISLVGFAPLILLRAAASFVPDSALGPTLVIGLMEMLAQAFAIVVIIGLVAPMLAQVLLQPYRAVRIDLARKRLRERGTQFAWASVKFVTRLLALMIPFTLILFAILQGVSLSRAYGHDSHFSPERSDMYKKLETGLGDAPAADPAITQPSSSTEEAGSAAYEFGYKVGKFVSDHPLGGILALLFLLAALALLIWIGFFIGTSPRKLARSLFYGPAMIMERLTAKEAITRSSELHPSVRGASYSLIGILAALYLADVFVEGTVALLIRPTATPVTYWFVRVGVDVGVMCTAIVTIPVILVALTLLYFRARQSQGETIGTILEGFAGQSDSTEEASESTLSAQHFSSGSTRS